MHAQFGKTHGPVILNRQTPDITPNVRLSCGSEASLRPTSTYQDARFGSEREMLMSDNHLSDRAGWERVPNA